MNMEERAKATAKNIEGKMQEAIGDLTGNPSDKAEGRAKQVEASAQHLKEDIKDGLKEEVDRNY